MLHKPRGVMSRLRRRRTPMPRPFSLLSSIFAANITRRCLVLVKCQHYFFYSAVRTRRDRCNRPQYGSCLSVRLSASLPVPHVLLLREKQNKDKTVTGVPILRTLQMSHMSLKRNLRGGNVKVHF